MIFHSGYKAYPEELELICFFVGHSTLPFMDCILALETSHTTKRGDWFLGMFYVTLATEHLWLC